MLLEAPPSPDVLRCRNHGVGVLDIARNSQPPRRAARRQKNAEVSCVVLTDFLCAESAMWFARVRDLVDELVIFVDAERATAATRAWAKQIATRVVEIATKGFIEPHLKELVQACQSEWVLRLDSDEQLSRAWWDNAWRELLNRREYTHFKLPRRWVHPSGRFISVGPWWPDPQMRLFRNDVSRITFPESIHDPTTVSGHSAYLGHLAIDHHVLRLKTRSQREQKVRHYTALRPNLPLGQYYLFEDFSPLTMTASALPQFNLTESLAPMQPLSTSDREAIFLSAAEVPAKVQCKQLFWPRVRVTNAGRRRLSSSPPFPVYLAYHWINRHSNEVIVFNGMRTELIPYLNSNSSEQFSLGVFAPELPGEYLLQITGVQENICWLEQSNPSVLCQHEVTVSPVATQSVSL
jgi:hypothetical protein